MRGDLPAILCKVRYLFQYKGSFRYPIHIQKQFTTGIIIGTAYNGLFPGFDAPEGFWASRDDRQKFMLHAEINLCSLFKRGEAKIVACTTMPCTSCMQALCAHGVKTIYYGEDIQEKHAQKAADLFAEICPNADVTLLRGGQPVYYYMISAE